MAHVTVTIAGRVYRMACNDGEEPHLETLAAQVDAKIADIRKAFGEIGDQRITVMAALTMADELSEARKRCAQLEMDLLNLKQQDSEIRNGADDLAKRLASSLGDAAERIEGIAQRLNGEGRSS